MSLNLDDYKYILPEEKIAKHPSNKRGESKLLFYDNGTIEHQGFPDIVRNINNDSLLVFNDTKVIPARIILHKESGARIEVFLLEPIAPSSVHEEVMSCHKECTWKCLIGNARKWKQGVMIQHPSIDFNVTRIGENQVRFEWPKGSFSELLLEIGKIPLPPYIKREIDHNDKDRYQTVYSKKDGAVAAPTAGLHFTSEIIEDLRNKGVSTTYLTLHVSAGTFQPIKAESITEHPMHNEQVWIKRETLESLLDSNKNIAVGTTSMRTLESLYWYGVKLSYGENDFYIKQEDPYKYNTLDRKEALHNVLKLMQENNWDQIGGQTEIFIYPGYTFKMCDGLITNFHMPGSTLILLVAAFIGEGWRKVYQSALDNGYRFLSYGDSSLLFPK